MEATINNIKIEEHFGLVRTVVAKFIRPGVILEDTEEYSDGLEGLMKAVKKYNPETVEFSTFAWSCIKNAVVQGIRRRKTKKRDMIHLVPLEQDVADNKVKSRNWVNPSTIVEFILAKHPDDSPKDIENKKILYSHYIEGKTFDEIGKEYGFTRQRANQVEQDVLAMLKERFGSISEMIEKQIIDVD